jgi:hypothetical protein
VKGEVLVLTATVLVRMAAVLVVITARVAVLVTFAVARGNVLSCPLLTPWSCSLRCL